jgi:MOSC domain-containing protein YiiM
MGLAAGRNGARRDRALWRPPADQGKRRLPREGLARHNAVMKAFETIADRLERLPQTGRVTWIGLRSARRAPVAVVERVVALAGRGLEGDRTALRGSRSRQVTLFQQEHLAVLAALAGGRPVEPALLRRNLVVSGINLLALRGRTFAIGGAILEGTGPCDPCSRMEEVLGPGGLNAMRGHGGITARVLDGGEIRVGDPVRACSASSLP